ncbi:GNAT family N-acetyltransferase [Lacrimispora celerecrescens]|uniref:Acetyltransferase (GNAT) family protein n=1 Tax=[Clostridium] celerecrescens 18A TaxID=1286362 RepID=A0A2M8Z0Y2_9FIRM|nr:GNAT family N-acetyltransferase [Lacrimispora celerecrescens]PJJ27095.1 acetyltransferase (GNAT) family protein [[Clostridium] celerecrescens 18A]
MNDITYKITTEGIHWQEVADVLRRSGLSDRSAKDQETIFKNSYAVVFVYDEERIVGVGRALSDGVCQAAIYNIALDEEYQGYGIGRKLIELLLDQVKGQNVILYTHPRTVALYEKMGFRRNKTAMSIFRGSEDSLNWMKKEGFLLPEKYRFVDEYGRDDMKQ